MAHELQVSVLMVFLPHFDVFGDLLLNRPMVVWNLFVLYNVQTRKSSDSLSATSPQQNTLTCHLLPPLPFIAIDLTKLFFFLCVSSLAKLIKSNKENKICGSNFAFLCNFQEYDATELVKNYDGPIPDILIDQVN